MTLPKAAWENSGPVFTLPIPPNSSVRDPFKTSRVTKVKTGVLPHPLVLLGNWRDPKKTVLQKQSPSLQTDTHKLTIKQSAHTQSQVKVVEVGWLSFSGPRPCGIPFPQPAAAQGYLYVPMEEFVFWPQTPPSPTPIHHQAYTECLHPQDADLWTLANLFS